MIGYVIIILTGLLISNWQCQIVVHITFIIDKKVKFL